MVSWWFWRFRKVSWCAAEWTALTGLAEFWAVGGFGWMLFISYSLKTRYPMRYQSQTMSKDGEEHVK